MVYGFSHFLQGLADRVLAQAFNVFSIFCIIINNIL